MTPWIAARHASLSITNSRSLLKLLSIKSVMPSNYFILCHPLLPPSTFSSIRVFSNESVLAIMWPKYWEFQLQHQFLPMNTQDWTPLGWTGWISLNREEIGISGNLCQKVQLDLIETGTWTMPWVYTNLFVFSYLETSSSSPFQFALSHTLAGIALTWVQILQNFPYPGSGIIWLILFVFISKFQERDWLSKMGSDNGPQSN